MLPMVVTVKEHGKCNEKEQSAPLMTAKPEASLLLSVLKVLHSISFSTSHITPHLRQQHGAARYALMRGLQRSLRTAMPGMAEGNQAVLCKNTK